MRELKSSPTKVIHRSMKKHKLLVREDHGSIRELTPKDTLWYMLYVKNLPSNKRLAKLFINRFRLYYSSFIELCNEISEHNNVLRWKCVDDVWDSPSNVPHLILSCLRYIDKV